jgi:hypothetical protein
MAITINQTPPQINLGQSPIAFSVIDGAYASSSFQYTCTLQIWTGSLASSGSGTQYALRKYPNATGYGIFDVSRFVNSALTNLAYQATSSVVYFKPTFNFQYQTTVTGSNVVGPVGIALDGYSIFPEAINASPTASYYWPIMTDGPQSQSVEINDNGFLGLWCSGSGNTQITYIGNYSSGTTITNTINFGQGQTSSFDMVKWAPSGPAQQQFTSFIPLTSGSAELVSYTIQPIGQPTKGINYAIECAYKYTPVRVFWKNRYGQFDFINFWYKNTQTFETEQRVYQPQLGSWNASQLSYNSYQTATQRYIVDATQTITVNTEFLPQDYNEIFKQLLVTDEVYWMYDQPNSLVKPLTIKTSNIQFKTGVNDKLIQYTITFDIGQPFKLII